MFLKTIAEEEATGAVAEIYQAQVQRMGFVMEAAQCLTTRPDLLPVYNEFVDKIRAGFSLSQRDWRLITLIAAKHVPSTYCSFVYGQQLIEDFGGRNAVLAVHCDYRYAGLSDRDVAMLTYAEKIAIDASAVEQADIDGLRAAGFTDQQISDIALCAAFRCFVGKLFDALGAGPEAAFASESHTFRAALAVGRPYRGDAGQGAAARNSK